MTEKTYAPERAERPPAVRPEWAGGDAGRPAPMSRMAKRVFIALAIIGLFTVLPKVASWSDASRMGTIQGLIDFHTFRIDRTAFVDTGDKVFVGGHYYSDKLTGPALFGAIFYWPLSAFGLKLGYGWNIAYYVITLCTIKVSWLAGLVAFYKSLAFTPLVERKKIWLTLALGVGSLFFTWSATFNNHALAGSWVAIGFYFMLRARHGYRVGRSVFLAGVFLALVGGTDVPILAVFAGFGLYVLADPRLRRHLGWYLLPLPLTALPALLINYRISGSFVPVQLVPEYFLYPGTRWTAEELTGAGMNSGRFLVKYVFNSSIGTRGFLIYNPLLFLAVPFVVRELSRTRPFFREARVTCVVAVPIVAYYLLYSNNYSGNSYSIRWFVPLLPLLFFFLHPVLDGGRALRGWFVALFAAGVVIAVVGLINPWTLMGHSDFPLVANLKTLPSLLAEARAVISG